MRTSVLKAASGIGTALVCAAATVLVAQDPRPSAAPLKPTRADEATTTTVPPGGGLVIRPACNSARAPSPSALTPAEQDAVRRLRGVTTAGDRRAILQALPPDERQQVTAFLSSLPRSGCANRTSNAEQVKPSVVAGSSGPAITNTHVS